MVQRAVVNVEGAGPSSTQKDALPAARAHVAVGPPAVPRRAFLEAEGIVEVRVNVEKIVVKPSHAALDADERSDLFEQLLVDPVTQESDEHDAEPQQHHEFEREISGLG